MKKWEDLPKKMQNSSVKEYYDILQRKKVSLFFKRLFDITFSLIGLIIASPFFIIVAIIIKIDSKGPVFFRQERVTQYNRTFRIYKFRTMISDADKKGSLVTTKNDSRITKVGKVIRKCRLDETPQLINILIGDMSFVGARPEVRKYVDKYTRKMAATLLMRAGATSMSSIKFKNEDEIIAKYAKKEKNIDDIYIKIILPQKMKINLEYIKNYSIINDIKSVFITILTVLGVEHV